MLRENASHSEGYCWSNRYRSAARGKSLPDEDASHTPTLWAALPSSKVSFKNVISALSTLGMRCRER